MGITEQLTHKVTSWCGNAFGITDPLWEESTGNRWIPHAKGQYCGAWTFPLKLLNKRTGCRRFETHQRSCDVTVKTWLGNDTSIKLDCHECMILNMCAFRGLWHRKRFWNKKKIENSKLSENWVAAQFEVVMTLLKFNVMRTHCSILWVPLTCPNDKINFSFNTKDLVGDMPSQTTESYHDVDFVVTRGTGGCHNDSLRCHWWRQS